MMKTIVFINNFILKGGEFIMKVIDFIMIFIKKMKEKKEALNISSLMMVFAHTTKSREELCYLAFVDKLTDNYNRNMLEEFREKFDTMDIFVSIVDIDNLEMINSTKGHHTGDKTVKRVANDLQEYSNWVFRLSGDEFLALGSIPISKDISGVSYGTVYKPSNLSLCDAMRTANFLMCKSKKKKMEFLTSEKKRWKSGIFNI